MAQLALAGALAVLAGVANELASAPLKAETLQARLKGAAMAFGVSVAFVGIIGRGKWNEKDHEE
jgi:gamma-glutamyl:cysteine ligase YbdK (ATP-grasp superfamily)